MDKLAILGGTRAVTEDQTGINDWPLYGDEEVKEVTRVLLLPGGYTCYDEMGLLEAELKAHFGVTYALPCTNGTAALHMALFGAGVGAGDEVIVPSYAYWSAVMTILCVNALPVFADIDSRTLNIDPADIERKITKRTKAIIALHVWGNPCDMKAIQRIARKHGLKVIEDDAHAHGATLDGKYLGTIGDAGCFSMQASKNLPALEGGFLLTNKRALYERALALGFYGVLSETKYRRYDKTGFGYKYRIHPLAAALARVQLRKLEAFNRERNEHIEYFLQRIEGLPGIAACESPTGSKRVFYGLRIRYLGKELAGVSLDSFLAALSAEGVTAGRERYCQQHLEPLFAKENVFDSGYPWNLGKPWRKLPYGNVVLPETAKAIDGLISLPTFQHAGRKLLDQYAVAFEKVCGQLREVPRQRSKKKRTIDGKKASVR
jgi:perosamine synthetase